MGEESTVMRFAMMYGHSARQLVLSLLEQDLFTLRVISCSSFSCWAMAVLASPGHMLLDASLHLSILGSQVLMTLLSSSATGCHEIC